MKMISKMKLLLFGCASTWCSFLCIKRKLDRAAHLTSEVLDSHCRVCEYVDVGTCALSKDARSLLLWEFLTLFHQNDELPVTRRCPSDALDVLP